MLEITSQGVIGGGLWGQPPTLINKNLVFKGVGPNMCWAPTVNKKKHDPCSNILEDAPLQDIAGLSGGGYRGGGGTFAPPEFWIFCSYFQNSFLIA